MKYYLFDGEPGWSGFKIIEYQEHEYEKMIDKVRDYHLTNDRTPTVFLGHKLEFAPAEIVKSWKIKERARE